MDKIVEVGSWSRMAENPVEFIKVSSRGLIGNDRTDFLTKRAGAHVFVDLLDRIKLASGDLPIHLIGLGATEGYGPNRNGDGFNERTCIECHESFMKNARFYRNHQNKDPDKSYGLVKLSAYNRPMRRVELLLIGNGSKEAAARNGGLVLPNTTIDKIDRGDDIPFSMACKVAYDVCSNCFNKAAHRGEYCTSDNCVNPQNGRRMEGCLTGLTKLASDGFQQYVENPGAAFFDMSEVIRPADRNAYGSRADYLYKAASAGVIGGAQLAEMWGLGGDGASLFPVTVLDRDYVAKQIKLAHQLAAIEQRYLSSPTERDRTLARAFSPAIQPPLDISLMGKVGSRQLATGLAALAGQKIALSLRDFLRLVSGEHGEKLASLTASVAPHLPGVFSRLVTDDALTTAIRSNPFTPSRELAPASQRLWAHKEAQWHSLDWTAVQQRAQRSAIRQLSTPELSRVDAEKRAAADGPEEALARQYACYKLAFLSTFPSDAPEVGLTAELVVLQNLV